MTNKSPLRLRRIHAGISQAQLAGAAGISQQFLSKLERGAAELKPQLATKISAVLNCAAAELIPELALHPQPETDGIQELELLSAFRRLSVRDRQAVLTMARSLDDDGPRRVTAN